MAARGQPPRTYAAIDKEGNEDRLFLRRHRAQIGDEIVKVVVGHSRIKLESHRRLELGAVLALTPRDGALDLRIRPSDNALLSMRRDVTRD